MRCSFVRLLSLAAVVIGQFVKTRPAAVLSVRRPSASYLVSKPNAAYEPANYPSSSANEVCICILTMNRVEWLQRLMKSVERHLPLNFTSHLHIKVDVDRRTGGLDEATSKYIDSIEWKHGRFSVRKETVNQGLANQWFGAADWDCPVDIIIVLEDDLEVGPGFADWAVGATRAYASHPRFGGVTLFCLPVRAIGDGNTVPATNEPVLWNRQLGTPGFVIYMPVWRQFLNWRVEYADRRPSLPGTKMQAWYRSFEATGRQGSMWSWWYLVFTQYTSRAVVFANLDGKGRQAFAVQHIVKGEHFDSTGGSICSTPAVQTSFPLPEINSLDLYDWDGARTFKRWQGLPKLLDEAKQLSDRDGFAVVNTYTTELLTLTQNFICNLRRLRIWEDAMFITTQPGAHDALSAKAPQVRSRYVDTGGSFKAGGNWGSESYCSQLVFRQHLLAALLEYGVNVWVVEQDVSLFADPRTVHPFQSAIRGEGDAAGFHDHLPHLVWPGFIYLRSSPKTAAAYRHLWMHSRTQKCAALDEMQVLSDTFKNMHVNFTPGSSSVFPSGKWYESRTLAAAGPSPAGIHNNWIVGAEAKVKRAKQFNHWWLDTEGQCTDVAS